MDDEDFFAVRAVGSELGLPDVVPVTLTSIPTPGDLSLVENVQHYTQDKDYVICQDPISATSTLELDSGSVAARLVVCGHIFHRRCIEKWLADVKTCPNCRTRVERDE